MIKNVIALYGGRFQPYHSGHQHAYEFLVKKFGKRNVYIGTSNKTGDKSPFKFKEKELIISTMFKIPKSNIIQMRTPYRPVELTDKFNPETTALIVGLGEKDANRLNGKYYEPYKGKIEKNILEGGYTIVLPQLQIKVGGETISGTQVRSVFSSDSDKAKKVLFKKLYKKMDDKIFSLLSKKIIKENPDEIRMGGERIFFDSKDAYPFGFINNEVCYIGDERDSHLEIELAYMPDSHRDKNHDPSNIKSFKREDWNYPGRLWAKDKIMSFWQYPKKNELKKYIDLINREVKRLKFSWKIDFNTWSIEIVEDKEGKYLDDFVTGDCEWDDWEVSRKGYQNVIIPLKNYIGSYKRTSKELGRAHIAAGPLKKLYGKKKMSKADNKAAWDHFHDLDRMKNPQLYEQFLTTIDIKKLIKEITIAQPAGFDVDDGPGTWYKNWTHYRRDVIEKATQHGWEIIDFILNGKESVIDGSQLQVTYFPAGVIGKSTPNNYKDLKGKAATRAWLKDIKKTALSLGFKFLDWAEDLEDIRQAEKSSKEDFKDQKEHDKEVKKIKKTIKTESKLFTEEWWADNLMLEVPHIHIEDSKVNLFNHTFVDLMIEKMKLSQKEKAALAGAWYNGKKIAGYMPRLKKYIIFQDGTCTAVKRIDDDTLEMPKDWFKYYNLVKEHYNNKNNSLLTEGGAYGHLAHPFDDNNLTFGDFKEMITQTLSGEIINHGPVEEKCVHGDTIIIVDNKKQKIRDIVDNNLGEEIYSYNIETKEYSNQPIMHRYNNGITEDWFELILENGNEIKLTGSHRVLTNNGYKKVIDLLEGDDIICF
jgi:hypothetical protein